MVISLEIEKKTQEVTKENRAFLVRVRCQYSVYRYSKVMYG